MAEEILNEIKNMDVINATEEELLELLDLTKNFTESDVDQSINRFINLIQDSNLNKENKNYIKMFYQIVGNKLKQFLKTSATNQVNTKFSTSKKINNFNKSRLRNNVTVVEGDQPVQIRDYVDETGLDIKQGYINPILRQEQTKVMTIDSSLRKESTYKKFVSIKKDVCGNCVTEVLQTDYELPKNPGNFLINLEEPLSEVISLRILSYEIPVSWYNISQVYGTNKMRIKLTGSTDYTEVKLDDGNYKVSSTNTAIANNLICPKLQTEIRNIIGFDLATVTYNVNTFKITISNTQPFDMLFYDENIEVLDPCNTNSDNSTKKSNLGYLLGFRLPQYSGETSFGNTSFTGEAAANLNFTNYLHISLNDFNSSFTNKIFSKAVDFDEPINTKLPSYYNKYLYPTEISGNSVFVKDSNLQDECNKYPVLPPPTNNCQPALDATPKLTQAQKYSVEQILTNIYNNKEIEQIESKQVDSNTVCRIINNNKNNIDSLNEELTYLRGDVPNPIKRQYFGPVTIKKFEVTLYNDKGRVVDLNLQDWSFSIEITQLYQF